MRKYYPHIVFFIVWPALLLLFPACNNTHITEEKYFLNVKKELFNSLEDNLSKPFIERVHEIPADLLKNLQMSEQSMGITGTDKYIAHTPTAEELDLINSYINLLPPAHQAAFSKKVLAIYFIDNFSSAGLTDWCIDSKGKFYYFMFLNSSLLARSIDDWLSYRENSTFDKSSEWPIIRVRTQTDFKALMYVLLHEGAHVVDYELGITPFIDPIHKKLSGRTQKITPFTDGVWTLQNKPVTKYDFKHRTDVNFYEMIPARGLIPRPQLPVMFSRLKKTPFCSFYAASAWYEDLAEYVTCYHIEKKLNGSVIIELLREGKVIDSYEPVKSPESQKREKTIQVFYN